MKKQYKSIIFDLDGTLINSEKRNAYALLELLKNKARLTHLTIEEILPKMGRTGTVILRDFDIPEGEIDGYLNDWIEAVYHESQKPIELFEGIAPMLATLHNTQIPLGIVSSKTRALYQREDINIDNYFHCVVLADDTPFHKPHPAPLLKYLEQSSFTADECIYIGDTYSDLICAKESGVDFGLACWGSVSRFEHETQIKRFECPNDILVLL